MASVKAKNSDSNSMPPGESLSPIPRLDLNTVADRSYGDYPWDHWRRWAIAQGLDPELAGLGHMLIREAYQHGWDSWLQSLCGWSDDGQALLAYAVRFPKAAGRRWAVLMRTDGLRGDQRPRSTEWEGGYLREDARRLRSTLRRQFRRQSLK